jgi:hypothetical protein
MMARRLVVTLTQEQRAELLQLRNAHPKAYVRERAAAILQIATGKTVGHVAQRGLVRKRQDETVSSWVKSYLANGAGGLTVRAGRGRKTKREQRVAKLAKVSVT